MDIKVTVGLDKLGQIITDLNEKAIKQAIRASITRTFQGVKTAMLKEINSGKFYDKRKLSTAKVKQRYFFEKKNLSANTNLHDMYAAYGVSSKRLDLIVFFAKRVANGRLKKDIPVKLKNGKWITLKAGRQAYGAQVTMFGKTRIYGSDFIGNVGKKSEQVFRRDAKGGGITKRTGPSLSLLFQKTNAADKIQNEANERMQRELEHNMGYFLSKL